MVTLVPFYLTGHWGILQQFYRCIFQTPLLRIDILITSCEIGLRWAPKNPTDDKSPLVWVMDWNRQATNHCLIHCWHRSMSPYDVTVPRRVNTHMPTTAKICQSGGIVVARLTAAIVFKRYTRTDKYRIFVFGITYGVVRLQILNWIPDHKIKMLR